MDAVYLRIALYITSTLLGMIPASWAGYVVYDAMANTLTISVEAVVIAIVSGIVMSAGVFRQWGVR